MSSTTTPDKPISTVDPVNGPVPIIAFEKEWLAIAKTKSGRASGPDDTSEFWKKCRWLGASWLAGLFNQVIEAKSMPHDW
ncbi:unnamed protein product [Strongylus vulgaris]|uniref:Uncharacterized protein n=1 Tax=Strongylus vulgaris TaxID=40348 RepID=A0A3P7JU03_STRVU|nr:unnamed protein product [Strongylus vulgaris]